MHRRLTTLCLPLMGAALVAAPIAVAAPAAAAGIRTAVIEPERSFPYDYDVMGAVEPTKKYIDEGFPARCKAFRDIPTPYVVPEIDDAIQPSVDRDYSYLTMYISGPGVELEDAGEGEQVATVIEEYRTPSPGDIVVHQDGVNADAVLCYMWPESQTTPSADQTSVTGPVVETDRVGERRWPGSLGLAAAVAALVAGVGGVVVSRRRQGAHR
jgi:hypothetical protein